MHTSCLVAAPPFIPAERKQQHPVAQVPSATTNNADPQQVPAAERFRPASTDATHDATQLTAGETAAGETSWRPVWELDELRWPEEVDRIYTSQTDYFHYAGEKLLDASREGLKVLVVASTREKEGCTTLVACLARSVAAAGARVALLDGNLLHPELGAKLGLDFSQGWQDALDAPSLLNQSAVHSLGDGVTLFPLSEAHRVTSLNDARVTRLLRDAARHFDLVIVDAGRIPGDEDQLFERGDVCPVNAAIIVRDVRRTTESETLITASHLKLLGIEAIGIAENFAPHQASRSAA